MNDKSVVSIVGKAKLHHFFSRKDVIYCSHFNRFRIDIDRFGMNSIALGDTPYDVQVVASRMVASCLGYNLEPYDRVLDSIARNEKLDPIQDEMDSSEMLYSIDIPDGLSAQGAIDFLLSQDNEYATDIAKRYQELLGDSATGESV